MNAKRNQFMIGVLLILGILVVINIISIRFFGRFDLTKNKVYSLSDASKNLIRSFDDRVTIRAYFTEDLPAPYNDNRREVLDMLNEYKAYAGGNLQFEFINPEGEKGEQEAREEGIPPVDVQVVKNDRFEVKRAYLGLVMRYEDKKETLPVIQNLGSLEYDISSALKRLTTKHKLRIGYTQGNGEPDLSTMKQAYQALTSQYEVTPVNLANGGTVPTDLAALLVIAPQKKFTDSSKYQIDQYLMRGGKIAFLLNKVNANLQTQYTQPLDLNLDDQLAQYGVRINTDLVRDAQCATISVVQQQSGFTMQSQVPFPYMPMASNFDKENMMVKDLQNVVFVFVSSVDTGLAASKGLQAEVLVRSSKRSGRQSGFFVIDPFHRYTAEELSESGIPLAAVVSGSFKSLYAEKPPPGIVSSSSLITASPQTRIIVVGDGDFMTDEVARNPGNLAFFSNIVDYLSDDAGLITIRSKDVAMPPLDQVSDGTKKMVKYGDLLLPPILVIGYGLLRWRNRLARKKMIEAAI
ncbi:MAG TPA: Gldg family protein [Bacteroidota bacterium]|nr:Gldg family protein [Bacteroidota bacterium]